MFLPSFLLWPPSAEPWQPSGRYYALTWPRNLTPKELKSLLSLLKSRALATAAKREALVNWAQNAQISSLAVGAQSREKITFWLWGEVMALVEEKPREKERHLCSQAVSLDLLRIYETAAAERPAAAEADLNDKPGSPKLLKIVLNLAGLESLLLLPAVYRRFYGQPEALLDDERALLTWLKRDGVEFLPLLLTQLETPEKSPWPRPVLLSIPRPTLWQQNLKQLLAHAHEFLPIGEMDAEIDGWLS